MKLFLWRMFPLLISNAIAYICGKLWVEETLSNWFYLSSIVALILAIWGTNALGESRFPKQWETYEMKRSMVFAVGGTLGFTLGAFLEFMFWM